MELAEKLHIEPGITAVIGSGGKTTLLARLAEELQGTVVLATSTRILPFPGISTASSCFIMELPTKDYGDDGVMLFGDCAVNIEPSADELAAIALATANTCRSLLQAEPRVAMLSFSTKGSAKHDVVTRVQEATAKAKELAPDLMLDGELQADAALVPEVANLKAPGSPVAGKNPNVLIFPNLGAGNIGYKLVQRLAGAKAIGPIIQGLAKPVNDLSRGCNVEEIVNTVAAVAVIAQ